MGQGWQMGGLGSEGRCAVRVHKAVAQQSKKEGMQLVLEAGLSPSIEINAGTGIGAFLQSLSLSATAPATSDDCCVPIATGAGDIW